MTKHKNHKNKSETKPNKDKNAPLLGAHLSIAKGLHNAIYEAETLGCRALQIFTKNAHTWKERDLSNEEIQKFEIAKTETGIKSIASHTSYLINLAGNTEKKHAMSCKALEQELIRSSMLNIPYVVLHPGFHMGQGEKPGIRKIADSINKIFSKIPGNAPRLLLETSAGQGTSLAHTFKQLANMIKMIQNKDKIGICLDTCHIFAAGYDIRSKSDYIKTIDLFDSIIGIDYLDVIHLNDSKKDIGSRVDRHEHIGKGFIGIEAFKYFMNDKRFINIPKIIETPKEKAGINRDKINLKVLKNL